MTPITNISRNQINSVTGKVIPYPNNLTAKKDYFGTVPEPETAAKK
jgi:hypothetical protein